MTTIPAGTPATSGYLNRDDRVVTIWGRISWGPIMMGAVCAIGLQFILTVLGIALGASVGDVTTGVDGTSVRTVGMTAGLWWLITGTISLAAGGFVLGRLSGLPRSMPLMLEAAAMWGVVALFGFLVVWTGAGMLSQAASPIGALTSSSLDPYASQVYRTGDAGERGLVAGTGMANDNIGVDAATAEEARRATRTASWWSVVGLLAGVVATVAAAAAAAPDVVVRETSRTM